MHKFRSLYTVSMVIETKVVIGWFRLQLSMLLDDLDYNFECVWFVGLSNNKLFFVLLEICYVILLLI